MKNSLRRVSRVLEGMSHTVNSGPLRASLMQLMPADYFYMTMYMTMNYGESNLFFNNFY